MSLSLERSQTQQKGSQGPVSEDRVLKLRYYGAGNSNQNICKPIINFQKAYKYLSISYKAMKAQLINSRYTAIAISAKWFFLRQPTRPSTRGINNASNSHVILKVKMPFKEITKKCNFYGLGRVEKSCATNPWS